MIYLVSYYVLGISSFLFLIRRLFDSTQADTGTVQESKSILKAQDSSSEEEVRPIFRRDTSQDSSCRLTAFDILLLCIISASASLTAESFFPDDASPVLEPLSPTADITLKKDSNEVEENRGGDQHHLEEDQENKVDQPSFEPPVEIKETSDLLAISEISPHRHLADTMAKHSKKVCPRLEDGKHTYGQPFFAVWPVGGYSEGVLDQGNKLLLDEPFKGFFKPPPDEDWSYLEFRKSSANTGSFKAGDHFLRLTNKNSESFQRHELTEDISEISNPMFMPHGNQKWVRDHVNYENGWYANNPKEELTGFDAYAKTMLNRSFGWSHVILDPKFYKFYWLYTNEHSDKEYVHSLITVKNAFSKEQIWSTCGERVMNAENCGFPTHLKLNIRESRTLHLKKAINVAQAVGYWHLLGEILPRLAFFLDEVVADESIHVLTHHDANYVTSFYEFLGLNMSRVHGVKGTEGFFVEELWLTQGTPCVMGRRWTTAKLHHQFQKRLRARGYFTNMQDRHILVARRVAEGKRRHIPNWEEMFDALVTAFPNERVVELNDTVKTLSDEANSAYVHAWMYISIFGAGLANMLFIPPGGVIIEITINPGTHQGLEYMKMALSCGHRYFGYACEGNGVGFRPEPDKLVEIVQSYIDDRDALIQD